MLALSLRKSAWTTSEYDGPGRAEQVQGIMVSNLPIDPARFVEAAAPLVDLPIKECYRDGVVAAFAGIVVLAELVMSFPLDSSLEPAPVFQP